MTRLFHTTVQTGPVEFEVSEVHCTKVSLGSLDNNSYLLHAGGNSPLLLIDAATEPRRLLGMMAGRPLGVVVSTHRHADHLQALAEVIAQTGAKPFAGRADAEAIAQQTGVASHQVWTGDQIGCGGVSLEVIGLVGHTPGSIALVLRGTGTGPTHIFSGDSLFPGASARPTHRPTSRPCWTMSPARSSTASATRPSSTRVMAIRRRLVPNDLSWRNGEPAAGDRPAAGSTARFVRTDQLLPISVFDSSERVFSSDSVAVNAMVTTITNKESTVGTSQETQP